MFDEVLTSLVVGGGELALRKRRMVRVGNPTCPSELRPWDLADFCGVQRCCVSIIRADFKSAARERQIGQSESEDVIQ